MGKLRVGLIAQLPAPRSTTSRGVPSQETGHSRLNVRPTLWARRNAVGAGQPIDSLPNQDLAA